MRKSCLFLLAIALLCFIGNSTAVYSQHIEALDYSIQHFNDENSLPQNSITFIELDRNGYLWMASQFGLIRYDGKNFVNLNSRNTPALRYNRIRWLGDDSQNRIFVKDEFDNYFSVENSRSIRPVYEYKDGDAFIIAKSARLMRFACSDSLQKVRFLQILEINEFGILDAFYLGARKGYLLYKNRNNADVVSLVENGHLKSMIILPFEVSDCKYFLLNEAVFFLHQDGSISIIKDGKLQRNALNFSGNRSEDFFKKDQWKNTKVIFNHTGIFLLRGDNMYRILSSTGKPGFRLELVFRQMPCKNVVTIFYHEKDDFYAIGTYADGLYILRKNYFKSKILQSSASEFDNVYAQLPLPGQRILTSSGTIFSDKQSSIAPIPTPERYSLFRDSRGFIWFFSGSSLYKTNEHFSVLKKIGTVNPFPVSFYEESPQSIWMMCTDGIYRIINDSIIPITRSMNEFKNITIQCFFKISDTSFLLGSAHGLYEYNYKKNELKVNSKATGLSVRTIYNSKDGNTYLGTYGQGFFRLMDTGLVAFPMDPNSYLTSAHCFLEDVNGFFWVSTNKGLFKMSKKELDDFALKKTDQVYYQYFDRSYGFNTNEFNGGCTPCGLKREDGLFSFPTLKGLVWFYPDSVKQALPDYKIFIDHIEINNRQVRPEIPVSIAPSFYQLRFSISSPYYGNSNNQKIEYNLSGLNDQWAVLNDDGQIVYNSLPSGNYVLQLRKKTGFEKNSYQFRQYNFQVLSRYYETSWFWLLIFIMTILTIYAFIKIRYRIILRSKRKLEQEVRTRTREQEQLIQHLEQSILESKESKKAEQLIAEEQERLISVIIHELKSPIKFHNKIATYLESHFDSLELSEAKRLARELKISIQSIHAFVDNFMFWLSTHSRTFQVKKELVKLDRFLIIKINKYSNETGLGIRLFPQEAYSDLTVEADAQLLEGIVRNILDYLYKYKGITSLSASLKRHESYCIIEISTQQGSLSDADLAKLNSFFTSGDIYKIEFHNEFCLKIVYDFAGLIGAGIKWSKSADNETGLAIMLNLP